MKHQWTSPKIKYKNRSIFMVVWYILLWFFPIYFVKIPFWNRWCSKKTSNVCFIRRFKRWLSAISKPYTILKKYIFFWKLLLLNGRIYNNYIIIALYIILRTGTRFIAKSFTSVWSDDPRFATLSSCRSSSCFDDINISKYILLSHYDNLCLS